MSEEQGLAAAFASMDAPAAPTNMPEPQVEAEQTHSDPAQPLQQDNADNADAQPHDEDADANEADDLVDDSDSEATESNAAPQAIEVRMPDGTIAKLTPEQISSGMLMQADYSRKTAEVAEKSRALEAQAAEYKQQAISQLEALNQRYQQLDPIRLLTEQRRQAMLDGDIEMVGRLEIAIEDTQREVYQIQQALTYEQQQAVLKQEAERETFLQEQRTLLAQKMPFISDPKRGAEFSQTLHTALQKVGYTDAELAGMSKPDHRQAMLAYYAGLYLNGQSAKPQTVQALKDKVVSPVPSSRQSQRDPLQKAIQSFDKNPNQTGSLAALFKSF